MTIATPFGQASTPDQTLTTKPLESSRPAIQNGTPTVTGEHAASIPVTIDAMGVDTYYKTLVAVGEPVTATEPAIFDPKVIPGSGSGPRAVVVQVVDLEPATTYHYRIAAEQAAGNGNSTMGPEGTFTTPPFPTRTPVISKARFRLRKGQVKVGKLTRKSRTLIVTIRGLPTGSKASCGSRSARGSSLPARKRGERPCQVQDDALQTNPQRAARRCGEAVPAEGDRAAARRSTEQRQLRQAHPGRLSGPMGKLYDATWGRGSRPSTTG